MGVRRWNYGNWERDDGIARGMEWLGRWSERGAERERVSQWERQWKLGSRNMFLLSGHAATIYIPTHAVIVYYNDTHTSQNVRNNSLHRLMKSYTPKIQSLNEKQNRKLKKKTDKILYFLVIILHSSCRGTQRIKISRKLWSAIHDNYISNNLPLQHRVKILFIFLGVAEQ